jgi:hypothetical protein
MRMSNFLSVEDQRSVVMAASNPHLGVAHPTVVPGDPGSRGDDGALTGEASDTTLDEDGVDRDA